jgi:hypothetical protein
VSRIRQRTTNIAGDWIVDDNISLTPKAPISVLVGLTSSIVVYANVQRKGLIVINSSGNTISLGLGTDAVLYKGITLYPGGTFNMAEEDFYSGVIYGIAGAVNSQLSIQEFS